ncbi:MAG: hypothetical protein LBQ46_04555 [Treponema sp.]|jgi:hypothetical protein|nr:hypothetical protein [Treponema sp.]
MKTNFLKSTAAVLVVLLLAGCGGNGGGEPTAAELFRDSLNALYPGGFAAEDGYVTTLKDLTLTGDLSIPSGLTLVVSEGKTLTVDATLDLTGGSLVLMNDATFTVNGTVNAKACTGQDSYGIVIMPGGTPAATINGSGIIHLTSQGHLLIVQAGQKLTLAGTVTLDGLTTDTMYPGTSTNYPAGIGGDGMNNISPVVMVQGELDMQGGTITGNCNTDDTDNGPHGGGLHVGKNVSDDAALFTMRSGAVIKGNKTFRSGAVNVFRGGLFTMKGGVISGNTSTNSSSGAVSVHSELDGDYADFIIEGGTVYGTSAGDNTNTPGSLYVATGCTAKWGATSTGISGGDGGGSQNGNIISGGTGTTTDTLTATLP